MDSIEERIGYRFSNSSLLSEALTHPSLAYESRRPRFDNQRLEFLGDAVIQLILTDKLFRDFPNEAEGLLTKLRSHLVSRAALCRFADAIGLGDFILLGKGEESSGGRKRPSNIADAFEALTGAIYLDGGYAAAQSFLFGNFGELIQSTIQEPPTTNAKGVLQEILQAISPVAPGYEIISQEGPDHEKTFFAEVSWEGMFLGKGKGSSKKEAEFDAASQALRDCNWLDAGKQEVRNGEEPAN